MRNCRSNEGATIASFESEPHKKQGRVAPALDADFAVAYGPLNGTIMLIGSGTPLASQVLAFGSA